MITATTIDKELAYGLEYSEAAYWAKYYSPGHAGLNCYGSVIAGAFAGAVPELDILALNRIIGLGMDRDITYPDIDDIINFYRKAGARRFFVQLSPHTQQGGLQQMLQEKGFKHHNNWVKLLRPGPEPLPPQQDTRLEVVPLRPEQAELYAQIIFMSFDWEDTRLVEWLAATVGKPDYRHYLVMLDNKAIAAGALHFWGAGYASMAFAGTLPEFRGMGAQGLLLRERIREAQKRGCRYLVSETAEEQPGKPVASYRNMRRYGFETAYLRQNWLYEF